jgi:HAMP domain-containing protein
LSFSDKKEVKTEDPKLVKDSYSNALLSVDTSSRTEHLLRRKQRQKAQDVEVDINTMKQEIDHLKSNIGEIKEMLNQLLNNKIS